MIFLKKLSGTEFDIMKKCAILLAVIILTAFFSVACRGESITTEPAFFSVTCRGESITTEPAQTATPAPPPPPESLLEEVCLVGTWHYIKSTEGSPGGSDERTLHSSEVEVLQDFEIAPPYLEIGNDGSLFANFIAFERIATLVQIDENTFEATEEDARLFEGHELRDILTFDPESGVLVYTWPNAAINHYFTRNPQ